MNAVPISIATHDTVAAVFVVLVIGRYLTVCRCAHTGNAEAVRAYKLYSHWVTRHVAVDGAKHLVIEHDHQLAERELEAMAAHEKAKE